VALHKAAIIPAARSAPTHGTTIPTIAPEDKLPLLDLLMIGGLKVELPIDVLLGTIDVDVSVEVLARILLSTNLFNSDSLDRQIINENNNN
jgi:hypothetical protein